MADRSLMDIRKAGLALVLLLITAGIAWLGYGIERHHHAELMSALLAVFAGYTWLMFSLRNGGVEDISFGTLLMVTLGIRLLLLFCTPELSDDVYRFLWDGRLLDIWTDPYRLVPDEAHRMFRLPQGDEVYGLLNHRDTYSTYPPFTQFFSWAAVHFGSGSGLEREMMLLRIPVIIADMACVMLLAGLLRDLGKPASWAFAYGWHPLVILELTANLHHEVWVVLFLLLFLRLFLKNRHLLSSVALAGAASAKLLPLIFLPAVFFRLSAPKKYTVVLLVLCITGSITLPMWSAGWSNGLGLYFQRFEFNPSVWAVLREVGWWFMGYNIIGFAGPLMAAATVLSILYVSYRSRSAPLPAVMVWCLTIYLTLATTVHPWYVVPLIPLGMLAGYYFPLVWGGLIMLTYLGYTTDGYEGIFWINWLEYGITALVAIIELKRSPDFRLWRKTA